MATLTMPDGKLTLHRRDEPSKPPQVMRLNLAQNSLDELLESLRDDQKARLRLGKYPSLHYGSNSLSLHPGPQDHPSELYTSEKGSFYFSGTLTHNLEVQKAKKDTAKSDEALANLEQSLNAFERGKESRKTPLITTIDEMKALKAGDNRTATGKQAASLTRMSTSRIDVEKERFFQNAASRSSPASPALLASRSPAPASSAVTPTSAPPPQNKDKIRLDALRVPLTHLLAIRPAPVKALAEQTRSTQEDCLAIVRKYGTENRLHRDKFDLKDKAYKELDVWSFPYPSQEDRQEAIENAISAFDRMRLSRQDKLWQTLLPKEEREKGKVLSRLNLRGGPVAKSATPRINVQASEEPSKDGGEGTGHEAEPPANGRLTPNMAAAYEGKQKAGAQKKRPAEKPTTTKRAPGKPKNTTLTGKVTKKADKRADKNVNGKTDTKFKSEEFVVDSDEDTEMVDVSVAKSPAADPVKDTEECVSANNAGQQPMKKPSSTRSSHEENGEQTKHIPPTKSQSTKTAPPPTTASRVGSSTSPQKPSPLGSSPPTNASDFEAAPRSSITTQSSSSSSPLINQLPKRKETSHAATDRKDASSNKATGPPSPSLKRKADADTETGDNNYRSKSYGLGIGNTNGRLPEPKRRRPSSPSSGGSSTGSASPPIGQEILRQRLRDKSRQFKQYYAKYRALHEAMSKQADPPRNQLEKLERQHVRLEKMKQEIWDEDRRLRMS